MIGKWDDYRWCDDFNRCLTPGTASSGLNVSYALSVERTTQTNQTFFIDDENKVQSISRSYELVRKDTCVNHSVFMPVGKLNLSQTLSVLCLNIKFFCSAEVCEKHVIARRRQVDVSPNWQWEREGCFERGQQKPGCRWGAASNKRQKQPQNL